MFDSTEAPTYLATSIDGKLVVDVNREAFGEGPVSIAIRNESTGSYLAECEISSSEWQQIIDTLGEGE